MNKKIIFLLLLILVVTILPSCKESLGEEKITIETPELVETETEMETEVDQLYDETTEEIEGEVLEETDVIDEEEQIFDFNRVESELTLREYPDYLDDIKIIVGKEAPARDVITATGIQVALGAQGVSTESILHDEWEDHPNSDFIIIGEPCVNPLVDQALDIGCDYFDLGVAKIELIPLQGREVIILTGYNSDQIQTASDVLNNLEEYLVLGKKLTLGAGGSEPTLRPHPANRLM